jgi:hypothetical protein
MAQRPNAIYSKISAFTLGAFADVASEATWSKIKYVIPILRSVLVAALIK